MDAANPANARFAIDELVAQARTLGRAQFAQRYAAGFVVRRPSPVPREEPTAEEHDDFDDDAGGTVRLGFKTGLVAREDLAVDLVGEDVVDPAAWFVAAISKRSGNPYPDRIGFGRARNCDVVIRWPSVSKLHAHLHLEDGVVVRITDCNSANGTFVNGHRVGPSGMLCSLGARLRLGDFETTLMSADDVFGLLGSIGVSKT
jgi:hypothetical protein